MTDDHLEQNLRRIPAPELPPRWRDEILVQARQAAGPSTYRQRYPSFLLYLRNLFAQNPLTATALTTLWLLIFLLHLTTPSDPSSQLLIAKGGSLPPLYFNPYREQIQLALLDSDQDYLNQPSPLRP
jgi:hypothetical protein